MNKLKLRHVAVVLLTLVGMFFAVIVGMVGGGLAAGFVSAMKPAPRPVEVIRYVTRPSATPVSSSAAP